METQEGDNPEAARQKREERMRYEVLRIVCQAARRDPNEEVTCAPFSESIGAWREELFRVLEFLDRVGLLRSCGVGTKVCITPRGIDYLYGEGRRRKAIPDEP